LLIFKDHPLIGVGGGSFEKVFAEYIYTYYPWALKFQEVVGDIEGRYAFSAMCLYTRVFGEHGIIGVILFFGFLIGVLSRLEKLKGTAAWSYIVAWVSMVMAFYFQFASYALTLFWIVPALLINIPDDRNKLMTSENCQIEKGVK
jgi:hypothetical protein